MDAKLQAINDAITSGVLSLADAVQFTGALADGSLKAINYLYHLIKFASF